MSAAAVRPGRGLLAVVAVAVAARAIAIAQASQAPFWDAPVLDETALLRLADGLARGQAPPQDAFYQAPGYAYFLAAIRALGGGVVAVKLVQAALGVANCALVWALARRHLGPREAVLAGVLWAVYPVALLHELLVLKPTLAVLASLLALAAMPVGPAGKEPSAAGVPHARTRWVASGLALGLAAVVQAEVAAVAVLLGLAALVRGRRGGARAAAPGLAGGLLAFALVLAVPTIQNAARGGGFVLVAYGGGTNFYIGNHARAHGSYVSLRPSRSDPAFEEADAVALAAEALGRAPRPAEVARHWFGRGLDWWRQEPLAALALTGRKLALLWGPQEQADGLDTALAARWVGILANPLVRPQVLLPAALVGLWLTRRRRDLWPLRAFVLGSTLAIVPFFVFERFRMPMTAVALPFAAAAFVALWDALRARRLATAAAMVLAGAALAALVGTATVARDRMLMRANIGNMLLLRGRHAEALAEFEAVRAARPAAWRIGVSIASAQAGLRRTEDALRTLAPVFAGLEAERRSTGRLPREEALIAHALAGDLELAGGRPAAAAGHYRAALGLAPGHPALARSLAQADSLARE